MVNDTTFIAVFFIGAAKQTMIYFLALDSPEGEEFSKPGRGSVFPCSICQGLVSVEIILVTCCDANA